MKHGKSTTLSHSRRKITLPEMLTETLGRESRYDYLWCSAIKVVSSLACGAGMSLLLLLVYLAFKPVTVAFQSQLLLTSLLLVSVGFYTSEIHSDRKRKQERLITKLQNHAVAITPALMLMHQEQDSRVFDAASRVLKAHLPMLGESDFTNFNESQGASLCNLLKSADRELVLAAIGALRYVGDEQAIDPLNALLVGTSTSRAVRAAAEISLHSITSRAAKARQARTLLRAGAAAYLPSSLLRSSGKDNEVGAEQLVRAAK
jgi:hypothetical protein